MLKALVARNLRIDRGGPRVDAAGESNLFATVDDLTRRVKAKFSLGTPAPAVQ